MKKALVFSLLFLVVGGGCVYANGVQVGIKGGGNVGWLSGSDWEDELADYDGSNRCKFGFTFGLFFDLPLARFLSIQPEVLFGNGGGGYTYTDTGIDFKGKIIVNSLKIPLYVKPKFHTGSGFFYLVAGPDLVLVLGDMKNKKSASGISVSAGIEPDNSFLLGVAGGIGYTFSNGVLIEVTYNRTLTEVFENDDTRFNGVVFMMGYTSSLNR